MPVSQILFSGPPLRLPALVIAAVIVTVTISTKGYCHCSVSWTTLCTLPIHHPIWNRENVTRAGVIHGVESPPSNCYGG